MKHIMKMTMLATSLVLAAGSAHAFECKVKEASMSKPGGFPDRALTMIVPYGPAGGSGQVAAAMAEAVTSLTGVSINRDHKSGGSGTVGMTAYMAAPTDGYTVLEHIDDASSAHALDSSKPNPAVDLIPLVTSQVTFSQIYIRSNESRYNDWPSFVEWVKAQNGKATIANVSKEGSMERVTMKFITDATGMSIQQISFDKGAPRYGALLGGQVDALYEQPGDVRKFLTLEISSQFLLFLTSVRQFSQTCQHIVKWVWTSHRYFALEVFMCIKMLQLTVLSGLSGHSSVAIVKIAIRHSTSQNS